MNQLKNKIFCGGNLEVVTPWPSNFISAILTDPPYGLGFMGKDWDTFKQENVNLPKTTKLTYKTDYINGVPVRRKNPEMVTRDSGARRAGSYDLSRNPEFQQWFTVWAKAMLRITKPGGFLLCFGGTRTYHRLACAIEDAGWEIRDCMMWLYGSGFPKSHNISKAIDKAAGAKRKVLEERHKGLHSGGSSYQYSQMKNETGNCPITAPATELAKLWDGYGTALKPAWEPIIVAMKPLDGTFAHNAEKHGVAGLNIDAARIGTETRKNPEAGFIRRGRTDEEVFGSVDKNKPNNPPHEVQGRWPANLVLDEEAGAMLDEQTGTKKSGFMAADTKRKMSDNPNKNTYGKFNPDTVRKDTYGDSGGVSRFFYQAKVSCKERNIGMVDQKNNHPTLKPLTLMKYLCSLLKMPPADQIILDPFLGSGTTGMACKELGINFIGIEKEREYCEISVKRIAAVPGQEITLHVETPPPVTKTVETDEQKQKMINVASAALRRNQK
jgi:site-specific DNA-methyltransferase (adenine-specific)